MFDLFRFILLRPPSLPAAEHTINIDAKGDFGTHLREARGSTNPRTRMREVADTFVSGEAFIRDPVSLAHAESFRSFHTALAKNPPRSLHDLEELLEDSFPQFRNPSQIVADPAFGSDTRR